MIYWPIADTAPSSGQSPRLLPFAGDKVIASGKVYERGGSMAIVLEKIEAHASQKWSFIGCLPTRCGSRNQISGPRCHVLDCSRIMAHSECMIRRFAASEM